MLNKISDNKRVLISVLLRVGLAFTLLYAAIAGFMNPLSWIGFIPSFIANSMSVMVALKIFGIIQIILAIWLLSNWKIYYAAKINAALVLAIILFNLGAMGILFRDVAIFFASLALAVLSYKKKF